MYKIIYFTFIAVFTLLTISCSNSSDHSIDKDKVALILADIMLIDAYVVSDSVKAAKLDSVLKMFNTNPADFNAIKINYQQKPEFWRQIYQDAEKILKERRAEILSEADNRKKPLNR